MQEELAKSGDLQATQSFVTLTDLRESPSVLVAWFPYAPEAAFPPLAGT